MLEMASVPPKEVLNQEKTTRSPNEEETGPSQDSIQEQEKLE